GHLPVRRLPHAVAVVVDDERVVVSGEILEEVEERVAAHVGRHHIEAAGAGSGDNDCRAAAIPRMMPDERIGRLDGQQVRPLSSGSSPNPRLCGAHSPTPAGPGGYT